MAQRAGDSSSASCEKKCYISLFFVETESIEFSSNKIINYCLTKKVGLKDEPSPRVLVNWVDKRLVQINPEDKGKIKRFDK